jgi:hypothetical protein
MPWNPRGSKPPDAGIVDGTDGGPENAVSFKVGVGSTEGETLIADGDRSDDAKGFDKDHDHSYPDRYVERGDYTGPGGSGS